MPLDATVEMPPLDLRAQVRAESVNEETRTVELVWTTGAAVRRSSYRIGDYMEVLRVDEASIRLDRLKNGAPFLNSHNRWELGDVLGVVEDAWIEGGKGYARVRISDRDEVEPIWRDIKAGIIRQVSVGYIVHRYEVDESDEKLPVHTATDWEPFEISGVPVGADPDAGFRKQAETHPCVIHRADARNPEQETSMPKDNTRSAGDPAENKAVDTATRDENSTDRRSVNSETRIDDQAAARRAIAEERQRAKDIRDAGAKLRIDANEVDKAVEDGVSVDHARARFIDLMADADAKQGTETEVRSTIRVNRDEMDTRRELVGNAIEHRLNPKAKLEDGAREFRGMSLLEIGRELLQARGESVRGLSKMQLAAKVLERGYHSTSDFPLILANVANKRLRGAYELAPKTFEPICNRVTLPDFKTASVLQLGQAPALEHIPEGAEYKAGTFGENRAQYGLLTYGRKVTMTRQMIVNDDLNAFDRILRGFGSSASNLESDIVWGIICTNGAMADGFNLFSSDHANLATAGAITIANLGAAKALMRKQTALDGESLLNIEPAFLAVPAELETVALQYTRSTFVPETAANQNVHGTSLTPIIEPRLASLSGGSADDWYLFADPNRIDTIHYGYLEGEEGVQLDQMADFDTDGVSMKARLDFAAGAVDFRGGVKNPGS